MKKFFQHQPRWEEARVQTAEYRLPLLVSSSWAQLPIRNNGCHFSFSLFIITSFAKWMDEWKLRKIHAHITFSKFNQNTYFPPSPTLGDQDQACECNLIDTLFVKWDQQPVSGQYISCFNPLSGCLLFMTYLFVSCNKHEISQKSPFRNIITRRA